MTTYYVATVQFGAAADMSPADHARIARDIADGFTSGLFRTAESGDAVSWSTHIPAATTDTVTAYDTALCAETAGTVTEYTGECVVVTVTDTVTGQQLFAGFAPCDAADAADAALSTVIGHYARSGVAMTTGQTDDGAAYTGLQYDGHDNHGRAVSVWVDDWACGHFCGTAARLAVAATAAD